MRLWSDNDQELETPALRNSYGTAFAILVLAMGIAATVAVVAVTVTDGLARALSALRGTRDGSGVSEGLTALALLLVALIALSASRRREKRRR